MKSEMRKKAQITLFILAGIAILVGISFAGYMYYKSERQKSVSETELQLSKQVNRDLVNSYISGLLLQVGEDVAKEIAWNGATFNPQSDIFFGNGSEMDYISIYGEYRPGGGIVNTILQNDLSRQNIQYEIERVIEERLIPRLDFTPYEQQGYIVIEEGLENSDLNFKIDALMDDDKVVLSMDYPIFLEKGDDKIEFENFTATVRVPLGRLYGVAVDITNDLADDGHVNKENYMLNTGNDVRVERHQPYPNQFFILREFVPSIDEDIVMRFAIKGLDTVALETLNYRNEYGCCTNKYDNYHYKNVMQNDCSNIGGKYDPSPSCTAEHNVKVMVTGCCSIKEVCSLMNKQECLEQGGKFAEGDLICMSFNCNNLDCNDTFSGEYREHGESWCEYEGRVGDGNDYVGTRHYLHSCINGEEYIEPCRDYREEICVHQWAGGQDTYSKAACRINRWQDCVYQGDPSSCEDERYRDCMWGQSYLALARDKCHPISPPGFKFWQGNGQGVCQMASQSRQGSIKKAYVWADGAFFYCLHMGDCGHMENRIGVRTTFGWGNKWGKDPAPNYGHPPFTRNSDQIILGNMYMYDYQGLPSIPSGGRGGGDAWCSLWRPPYGGDCSECMENPEERPCTEYKCKSLGAECTFSYDEAGNPICDLAAKYVLVTPNGTKDPDWQPGMSSGYLGSGGAGGSTGISVHEDPNLGIGSGEGGDAPIEYITYPNITFEFELPGYRCGSSSNDEVCSVEPDIGPYEEFGFMINTGQDTMCTMQFDMEGAGPFAEMLKILLGDAPSAPLNDGGEMMDSYDISLRLQDISLVGGKAAQLMVSCINEYGIGTVKRLRIPVRAGGDLSGTEVLGSQPEMSSLGKGGQNSINLMVSKPMKDCYYGFSGSSEPDLQMECKFRESEEDSGEMDLTGTILSSKQEDVEKLMSLVKYKDLIEIDSELDDKELDDIWMDGQILYDTRESFGYYPCYGNVDVPANADRICFSCEDIYGTMGPKVCEDI